MGVLQSRRVVLGVSGGIAAYKAVELLRLLVRAGARVDVVMTAAAQKFVAPLTFETLSRRPVGADLFALDVESRMSHVRLADEADLLVVAPATADVIGRMANGLADDLLTTLHLATRAKVLLAPAMNSHMWENALVQANLARLVGMGRTLVVGPDHGELAEGYEGPGRMAEPAAILEAAEACLARQDFAGARVVVAAGPTREPIDAVRDVANRSSGRMGFAVARAARARGAAVTLVAGPAALAAPWGVARVDVRTAAEMKRAVTEHARGAAAVVMAAAVADFRPERPAGGKIRKREAGGALALRLVRTDDILAALGRARKGGGRPVLVGFAAEPGIDAAALSRKRAGKRCDLLIANDVTEKGVAFDAEDNHVWIVSSRGVEEIARAPKLDVAHAILDRVAPLIARVPG